MTKHYHDAYVRLKSKPTGRWLVHPDLRARLVADADRRDATLTDVVVGILAANLNAVHTPRNGRSRSVQADSDILKVRVPIAVWRALGAAAVASDRDVNDVIRESLCAHYGLGLPGAAVAAA